MRAKKDFIVYLFKATEFSSILEKNNYSNVERQSLKELSAI
jgi:hypothetical protein